ncbi:hypothetical protein [Burkholderia pseudomallei]
MVLEKGMLRGEREGRVFWLLVRGALLGVAFIQDLIFINAMPGDFEKPVWSFFYKNDDHGLRGGVYWHFASDVEVRFGREMVEAVLGLLAHSMLDSLLLCLISPHISSL